MTIKTCKTAVRASAVLAAIALSGGAFATEEGISESFETDPFDTKLTGNGKIATAEVTEPTVGYPISTAAHTKALEIAGTVTYAEGSAPAQTGASQVDFMFKVEATDELENPTGDDIRVALAVGTNDVGTTTAPIKLWCKPTTSAAPTWVSLGDFATGTWVRATLVLDYGTTKKCSVSLNGNPVLNTADSSSKWFYFVNDGGTYVASITMVGSTMVDDFVVTHTALANYEIPGGNTAVANAGGVTYDYINKYGVTVDQAQSSTPLNAESGMSVADKFVAGLNPKSPTKFEMQSMTMTSATTATIKFPGNIENGYTVKAASDKEGTTQITTATVTPGAANEYGETINSAEFTGLSDSGLIYFHVETK